MNVFDKYFRVPSTKSPLRYPGGKSRALSVIQRFIPPIDELVSPFVGGGSVELFYSARSVRVHAYDGSKPVATFWRVLLSQPRLLAEQVRNYFPLSADMFEHLKHTHRHVEDELEMAAQYFALNRSSFSGITTRGRLSPSHPRFTEQTIERLSRFYSPNLSVGWSDFRESLPEHPSGFCYADPPYVNKSRLYGATGGRMHTDFDHAALAELLRSRSAPWLVSYNDCPEVRQLYRGFDQLVPASWSYGIQGDQQGQEILIANYDLSSC